jgi:RNA polymerase sigma-70 factor, ECF subfamily
MAHQYRSQRGTRFASKEKAHIDRVSGPIDGRLSTWSRDIADGRTLPIRQLLQQEIQILVHEAITSLPAMYGDVFRLRELEGRSIYESAEMLGVSESVIKIRLHRARQKLKRYLRIVYPSNFPVEKLG